MLYDLMEKKYEISVHISRAIIICNLSLKEPNVMFSKKLDTYIAKFLNFIHNFDKYIA